MSGGKYSQNGEFSFGEAELTAAAGAVRESMLKALPEPEECKHEFSARFEKKMQKLLQKEQRRQTFAAVRRWAAAIILLLLVSGGTILTVDAEARASFFDWVREVYENSIVYRFFNEPQEEALPTYELGWVPEGYELVDLYQDDTLYSAVYQIGDDKNCAFILDYSYAQNGSLLQVWGEETEYKVKEVRVNGMMAEFYLALDEAEPNTLVWIDDKAQIIFSINGYLNESDMLHIAENMFLGKMTK